MHLTRARCVALVSLFASALGMFGVAALFVGATSVDFHEALTALIGGVNRQDSTAYQILMEQRLPRIILAALTGAGLSMAGVSLQAILRNPLADPYTLGVASGSAVGAVIALSFGIEVEAGPFNSIEIFSLIGAAMMMAVIYALARGPEHLSTDSLLLAGVTVALIASSAIMFVRYLTEPHRLAEMDRWLMGGLVVIGYTDIVSTLPLLTLGCLILFHLTPEMNQIAMGEDMAFGRGVSLGAFYRWGFTGASLVTAAVVAVTGPIGFIGLIVPHAVRRLTGPDHRVLMPCAALAGGAFLIVCDAVGRTIISPAELPVGVVTAICGGPFFLYLLLRYRRRNPRANM